MDKDYIGEKSLEVMAKAKWYNHWLFEWLRPHLGGRVLEIGAGIGNFTGLIAKSAKEVVAVDFDPSYLKSLKRTFGSNSRVKVVFGDIEKNTFGVKSKGSFDSIVCLNVLEHIKADEKALKNMKAKLKKRGKLLLLVPAHKQFYGVLDVKLGHFRRYSKRLLSRKLAQAGFKVETLRYLNSPGALGWYVNARILKKEVVPAGQLSFFDRLFRLPLMLERLFEPPFGLSVLAICRK